jgi:hypothetical protein
MILFLKKKKNDFFHFYLSQLNLKNISEKKKKIIKFLICLIF